jgi:hypothetical protein
MIIENSDHFKTMKVYIKRKVIQIFSKSSTSKLDSLMPFSCAVCTGSPSSVFVNTFTVFEWGIFSFTNNT